MAVSVLSVSSNGVVPGASPHTWAFTCPVGTNRLVVGHQFKDAALSTPSGVTYNGVAMTGLGTGYEGGSGDRVRLYELANPDVGSSLNIVASFTGDPVNGSVLGAWALSDADAAVNVGQSTNTTDPGSIAVSNAAGGLVIGILTVINALTINSGSQDFNTAGQSGHFGVGLRGSNQPSQTFQWTQGVPDSWSIMAASFPALTAPAIYNMNVLRTFRPRPYSPGSIR